MTISRRDLEDLGNLLVEQAFRYSNGSGPFVLASGETSKYYYYGKSSTLLPSTLRRVAEALVEVILRSGAEAVGGLEIGSVPISTAVGLAALDRGKDIPTFVVRKQRKGHGTDELIAQAYSPDGELLQSGRPVAIVDDVITKGGSVQQAIDAARALGCRVVLIAVLVERHEGGGDALRARGYDVVSIFRTDEEGRLSINEAFVERLKAAQAAIG